MPADEQGFELVSWLRLHGLTAREQEVLAAVVEGKSNREIAQALVIREVTVETHLYRIYQKLGVSSRTQAAIYVLCGGRWPKFMEIWDDSRPAAS